jgi:hypothetical protein
MDLFPSKALVIPDPKPDPYPIEPLLPPAIRRAIHIPKRSTTLAVLTGLNFTKDPTVTQIFRKFEKQTDHQSVELAHSRHTMEGLRIEWKNSVLKRRQWSGRIQMAFGYENMM